VAEQLEQLFAGKAGRRQRRFAIVHCMILSGLFLLLNGRYLATDDNGSPRGSFEMFHASDSGQGWTSTQIITWARHATSNCGMVGGAR
jgi:hypothetical protein